MYKSDLDNFENKLAPLCDNIPGWLMQRNLILKGEATWEDFTFQERTCKGFLWPYVIEIDSLFSKRWNYWFKTIDKGSLLKEQIPYINFCGGADPEAMKNLKTCLTKFVYKGVGIVDFLNWLLWGFGEGEERPKIDDDVNEFWYKTFNLGLMLQSPHDYIGDILMESKAGYWNNPNAFFPTPHTVCEMMVAMNANNESDNRIKTVCDPCVGTGRMLLHASNHSLFLYGQDIDYVCVKACKINGYLYMPWLVRPGLKHLEKKPVIKKDKQVFKNTISLSEIPIGKINRIEHQLTLFN